MKRREECEKEDNHQPTHHHYCYGTTTTTSLQSSGSSSNNNNRNGYINGNGNTTTSSAFMRPHTSTSSPSPAATPILPLHSRSRVFTLPERRLSTSSSSASVASALSSSSPPPSSSLCRSGLLRRKRRTLAMGPLLLFQVRGGGAFAALLALLLPVFCPSLFSPLGHASPFLLSEYNIPKPRHSSLLKGALQREISDEEKSDLWAPLVSQGWKPCIKSSSSLSLPKNSRGYIQVFLDGGLNQQRMGVCDAVAVAKILNATLVIPHLEVNPVWKDSSSFEDIFDVNHFIDVLKDDVSIVRELPAEYSWSTREYYAIAIRPTRVKTAPPHASANWYLDNVVPVLQSYGIAAIAPFSHRLAFNMPEEIQWLRCKVNFKALEFVPRIKALGDALVNRLRYPVPSNLDENEEYLQQITDENKANGKFVALHLRFDKDMAAHSACDFGGGKAEKLALAKYRQVIWQGRVLNSQFTDEELRSQGRCPLTPEEIGLLLAALGFDSNTRLYLASHKVYGGEARLSTLRKLFPLMEDKKSLVSKEELSKVEGKASLLAAVDYYVSMQSDIFISASPGNMHNAMVGHRTFENLKTIRPNMALLGQLFLNKTMAWSEFQQDVQGGHKNRQGEIRLRKQKQSIYTYPAPDCMCEV